MRPVTTKTKSGEKPTIAEAAAVEVGARTKRVELWAARDAALRAIEAAEARQDHVAATAGRAAVKSYDAAIKMADDSVKAASAAIESAERRLTMTFRNS